ncbi:MAG: hypothetical protein RLY86_2776 [Pseudomonadota bacterium]
MSSEAAPSGPYEPGTLATATGSDNHAQPGEVYGGAPPLEEASPADRVAAVFGGGRPVILQIIPSLVTGGAERGCIDVAAAIQRAGGRAIVVSSGGPMARELERHGATHITLPVDSKNPLTIRRNAGKLQALIREHGVDIMHARSRAPAWSALWAARAAGIPFVTTFHAPYNFGNALKKAYNAVMAKADRVIAVSAFVAEHVRREYGVAPDRLRMIHRGVDVGILAPDMVTQARMAKLIADWRLPEDQRIILLPGRLTRWKGQGVLIQALARLGRADVRAVLVGDDQGRSDYRAELIAQVNALGLEGQVSLVGHCTDMAAAYMLADVVVNASTKPEAFGRVIAEAQAMGRPVIVTDLGAVRETVRDGETGLVVPPDDPDALAQAIRAVLDLDPLQRQAVGLDGIAHVRRNFTKDGMCLATLAVYAELLGS